jgi:TolB-like protein
MPDIFVSYARPEAEAAHAVARAFQNMGYDVWRDDQLPAHQSYTDVIEERLRASRAVVVLWSAHAVQSQWVRAEAELARSLGSLVQARLDGTPLPLPFNQIQAADLAGWAGTANHAGWRKILDSVAVLVNAGTDGYRAATWSHRPNQAPRSRLLAVLPFDNLSNDSEMTYFSDGISEEILQAVVKVQEIKVIARASSFQFRGTAKALSNVTAQLNTTHVLDGSVRRSGDRVRIAANLVECETQTTLWSDRFDRDLSDVFALQDEIATAVADALQVVFAPAGSSRKVDPIAYDLYLKARGLMGAWATNEECARLLEESVQRSPDLAEAWASLAMIRALDARHGRAEGGFEAGNARALAAADRALGIDPGLGLPFVARSILEPAAAYSRREAWVQRAVEVAPDQPDVLKQASDFVGSVGRTQESFRLIARAYGLDPLNRIIASRHAGALAEVGRTEECYEASEIARARWPDFEWSLTSPLLISASLGQWEIAEPLMAMARARAARSLDPIVALAEDFHSQSDEAKARRIAVARRNLEAKGEVELGQIVFMYNTGAREEAFEVLRAADWSRLYRADGRPPDSLLLTGILFGPLAHHMRRDRRFVELCYALGVCDYWIETERWPDFESEIAAVYDLKTEVRRLRLERGPAAAAPRDAAHRAEAL